jgi:hypothetical protein
MSDLYDRLVARYVDTDMTPSEVADTVVTTTRLIADTLYNRRVLAERFAALSGRPRGGLTRPVIVDKLREMGVGSTQEAVAEALGVTSRYLRRFGPWAAIEDDAREDRNSSAVPVPVL